MTLPTEPFTCHGCGTVSFHPKDKEASYCAKCHEFRQTVRTMKRAYAFRVLGMCITCSNRICGVIAARSMGDALLRIAEVLADQECDRCAERWHRKVSVSIEVGNDE